MTHNLSLGMIANVLPVAALVAVVMWLVYVIKHENDDTPTNKDRYEVSFQAAVATVAVYFMLKN